MLSIHSWKRIARPPFRFRRVWRLAGSALAVSSSPPPPKLPQFSETLARSFSISGGETTCNHTRPRSSDIEEILFPYDSSGWVSVQSWLEQTEVASSLTFIRWLFANSEKMLFG